MYCCSTKTFKKWFNFFWKKYSNAHAHVSKTKTLILFVSYSYPKLKIEIFLFLQEPRKVPVLLRYDKDVKIIDTFVAIPVDKLPASADLKFRIKGVMAMPGEAMYTSDGVVFIPDPKCTTPGGGKLYVCLWKISLKAVRRRTAIFTFFRQNIQCLIHKTPDRLCS